eukprot:1157775-Pelagomonas_calceolata.AAC.14
MINSWDPHTSPYQPSGPESSWEVFRTLALRACSRTTKEEAYSMPKCVWKPSCAMWHAGLMVMGRSLSRAALVTHENQEREGGSSEVGATSLQQNQQVPPSQGVERQGQQQEQQQQGQGPHDQPAGGQQKGQGGEAVGPQHHHAAASSEQSGGMRPMEVDTPSGMEIPLDL